MLHHVEFGEGRPLVVVHGWSLDHHHVANALEPVFEEREGWRRVYVDLPGHGRSAGVDSIADQNGMLDALVEFVDSVVEGERFVVAGVSAGAYLARGVVHRRAASIDGLLLVVPLVVPDDTRRTVPPHVTLVEDAALVDELAPDEAGVFQIAVVHSRRLLDRVRQDPTLAGTTGDPAFRARIREDVSRYAFSFDVDALAEPFAAPTLILAGRQDAVVGYRDAWDLLDSYPRATFAVLDRAGHLLEIEQEELFHALVSEWLDRVEEWVGIAQLPKPC
jgi:pimeloyl-ACP methyl ester carboxylesterase